MNFNVREGNNSNITNTINISNKSYINRNIIAMGDVHGDYYATVKSLRITRTIDKDLNWKAKNSILIQMGDILDRGGRETTYKDEDSELKIIYLFKRLKKQAQKEGGDVVCLIGNHELLNCMMHCIIFIYTLFSMLCFLHLHFNFSITVLKMSRKKISKRKMKRPPRPKKFHYH